MNDTRKKKECPKCLELRKEYIVKVKPFVFCSEECA